MIAILSHQSKKEIDQWLTKFPKNQRQSAVLYALTVVQKENGGHLTQALMDMVAAYLNMPKIAVYEVASFYSMFELSPVGKHKICICTNVACMLSDCEKITQYLKERLGIEFDETTPDGKFTLKAVECLAACNIAPVMQIEGCYFGNLTPERIDSILAELE